MAAWQCGLRSKSFQWSERIARTNMEHVKATHHKIEDNASMQSRIVQSKLIHSITDRSFFFQDVSPQHEQVNVTSSYFCSMSWNHLQPAIPIYITAHSTGSIAMSQEMFGMQRWFHIPPLATHTPAIWSIFSTQCSAMFAMPLRCAGAALSAFCATEVTRRKRAKEVPGRGFLLILSHQERPTK